MKISDKISDHRTLSFEIFPPKGDLPLDEAYRVAAAVAETKPDWISVTYSAGGSGSTGNTVPVAQRIEEVLDVTALAHLTCMGATRADIDDRMSQLKAAGIANVLALRGDPRPDVKVMDYVHASDLIRHLRSAWPELCIGAACYPEGHIESATEKESMEATYAKQEEGADFLVTQLFFDNEDFYRFRERCLRYRIKLPIIAGIMPFTSVKQIQRMAFNCGASIPAKVVKRLVQAGSDPLDQAKAGMEYACEQLVDLAENGVDGIHVYSMNRPQVAQSARAALLGCGYLSN
ncbi:MAG: methylenetetrahydrofolate reductase [Tractidigestivibacter sp.]|jgi:methylenetetrahydrofolate reductase (NADPH)|uniref:methylenetetrahydrofolate reductase n=1 Tax=Tractidigestivibacter sp. TaxID=2847320 RepID=UPI003D8D3774